MEKTFFQAKKEQFKALPFSKRYPLMLAYQAVGFLIAYVLISALMSPAMAESTLELVIAALVAINLIELGMRFVRSWM